MSAPSNNKVIKRRAFVWSTVSSFVLILLTGWLSYFQWVPVVSPVSYYLHLIPMAIGFTGGNIAFILLYYIVLWIVMTLLLKAIIAFVSRDN